MIPFMFKKKKKKRQIQDVCDCKCRTEGQGNIQQMVMRSSPRESGKRETSAFQKYTILLDF